MQSVCGYCFHNIALHAIISLHSAPSQLLLEAVLSVAVLSPASGICARISGEGARVVEPQPWRARQRRRSGMLHSATARGQPEHMFVHADGFVSGFGLVRGHHGWSTSSCGAAFVEQVFSLHDP